jgi:ribonuclease P protein component
VGARPVGRLLPAERVRRRSEFQAVQSEGRRIRTEHFVLLIRARDVEDRLPPRLGIVASRKVGNAVQRNRAKRLTREAFRSTRDLWIAGTDLVVIVVKAPEGMKLDDVVVEWRAASATIEKQSAKSVADGEARRSSAAKT